MRRLFLFILFASTLALKAQEARLVLPMVPLNFARSIDLNWDSSMVLTAHEDQVVIWEVEGLREITKLRMNFIKAAFWTADPFEILIVFEANVFQDAPTAELWDIRTMSHIHSFEYDPSYNGRVFLSEGRNELAMVNPSQDSLVIYDLKKRKRVEAYDEFDQSTNVLSIAEHRVVVEDRYGLYVIDRDSGEATFGLGRFDGSNLAYEPNHGLMFDQFGDVYDTEGKQVFRGEADQVVLDPKGRYALFVSNYGKKMYRYSLPDFKLTDSIVLDHYYQTEAPITSPDGNYLAQYVPAFEDDSIIIFDQYLAPQFVISFEYLTKVGMGFSVDSRCLETGYASPIWSMEGHRLGVEDSLFYKRLSNPSVQLDDGWIVFDRELWKLSVSGEQSPSKQLAQKGTWHRGRAEQGELLFDNGSSNPQRIKIETGKLIGVLDPSIDFTCDGYNSFDYSPSGALVINTCLNYPSHVLDANSGKLINSFDSYIIGLSSNEKLLVTMHGGVYELHSGELITPLQAHGQGAWRAVFTTSHDRLVTVANDSDLLVLDPSDGTIIHQVRLGTYYNSHVEVLNNERYVCAGGSDGDLGRYLYIVDIEQGKLVYQREVQGDFMEYVRMIDWPQGELSSQIFDDRIGVIPSDDEEEYALLHARYFYADKLAEMQEVGKEQWSQIERPIQHSWEYLVYMNSLLQDSLRYDDAYITPIGKEGLLTVDLTYELEIHDFIQQKKLYTRLDLGEGDYLVYDEHFRYDGTPAARELLYLVCGLEIIELGQMKDALYVPGLVEKIMKGEDINYPRLSDLKICGALPLVKQVEEFKYEITARSLGLEQVEVYVNDRRVYVYDTEDLNKQDERYILQLNERKLQQYLIGGQENTIEVLGVTQRNGREVRSRGLTARKRKSSESTVKPSLYAIMIGVSDYKDETLNLSFPHKDASDLGAALELSSSKLLGVDQVHLYPIYNSGGGEVYTTPEKSGIKKAIADIGKKAKPEDIVLIFFAGHGVMQGTADQKFTLLTAEASNQNTIGISTTELMNWLSPTGPHKLLANKVILILDACNSGQASRELMAMARNDEETKRIRQVEDLKDKSGLFILAASAANQSAYELPQYEQGMLTYCLLKTMKEDPSILDERSFLNVQKWFLATEQELQNTMRKLGLEQSAQPFGQANIRIGQVDSSVKAGIILASSKPLVICANAMNEMLFDDNLGLKQKLNEALGSYQSSAFALAKSEATTEVRINLNYKSTADGIICTMVLIKDGSLISKQVFNVGAGQEEILIQQMIAALEQASLK